MRLGLFMKYLRVQYLLHVVESNWDMPSMLTYWVYPILSKTVFCYPSPKIYALFNVFRHDTEIDVFIFMLKS